MSAPRFDPHDPDLMADPFPLYERLREEDPLHHVEDRDFWVLSRFADVFQAVRDTETFSSAQGLTFEDDEILKLGLAPTIVMMDPPRHSAFRRLVSRGYTPRRVAALEEPIRDFVVERVERLRAGGAVDLVEVLAGPLPTFVVAHFLGVPAEDRDQFDTWSDGIVQANGQGSVIQHAAEVVFELYAYFGGLVEKRRAEPGDDMLSVLLAAEVDGEALTVDEILGFCFVMIAGGNDTTTGLLGGAAALLTEHRDQRRLLLDDPGLIPGAVEEFLRLTCPVQGLGRTTTRPVTLHGTTVPEGRKVHLLYASANRDPREYGDDADALDVRRDFEQHLAFGSGAHYCLGAAVARLQARIALEELLARIPDFHVDLEAARFAPGAFIRRYEHLPLHTRS